LWVRTFPQLSLRLSSNSKRVLRVRIRKLNLRPNQLISDRRVLFKLLYRIRKHLRRKLIPLKTRHRGTLKEGPKHLCLLIPS
jgi:hypothetical protein